MTEAEKVKKGKVVKAKDEQPAEQPAKAAEGSQEKKELIAKKWKGKDWFTILSPRMFGESFIAETPSTDPKSITGRNVEVSVAELLGEPNKYYMKVKFKIIRLDGKTAYTDFNGYVVMKEHFFRVVRKGLQKIRMVHNVKTKDDWMLQMTTVLVLNRNTESTIQKKVRKDVEDYFSRTAQASGIEEFVKSVVNGLYQKNIKKKESKVYPVRFAEVEKIEVVKAPA